MGILVWFMVGLAIWHFAVFIPDKSWGGIIGAFVGATVGACVFGLIVSGFSPPGNDDMTLMTALEAIPGALIGVGVTYLIGMRQERLDEASRGGLAPRR